MGPYTSKQPWRTKDYFRTDFRLSSKHPIASTSGLSYEFSMKANQLSNVAAADALYTPSPGAVLQSAVFLQEPVERYAGCPLAYMKYGQGWLGYSGDCNSEGACIRAQLAMCGLNLEVHCYHSVPKTRAKVCCSTAPWWIRQKRLLACQDLHLVTRMCPLAISVPKMRNREALQARAERRVSASLLMWVLDRTCNLLTACQTTRRRERVVGECGKQGQNSRRRSDRKGLVTKSARLNNCNFEFYQCHQIFLLKALPATSHHSAQRQQFLAARSRTPFAGSMCTCPSRRPPTLRVAGFSHCAYSMHIGYAATTSASFAKKPQADRSYTMPCLLPARGNRSIQRLKARYSSALL